MVARTLLPRPPPGRFDWLKLDAQLGLKTLDEREDLQTYGDWSRVDVRPRKDGIDAIVIYVHDRAEIDTPGFRRFVQTAANVYCQTFVRTSVDPLPKQPPRKSAKQKKKTSKR